MGTVRSGLRAGGTGNIILSSFLSPFPCFLENRNITGRGHNPNNELYQEPVSENHRVIKAGKNPQDEQVQSSTEHLH